MDILIKNMEMPQEGHIEAYIWCNGTVTYRKKIDNQWDRNSTTAVALPEHHGRIVDISRVENFLTKWENGELDYEPPLDEILSIIRYSTKTIVEATE